MKRVISENNVHQFQKWEPKEFSNTSSYVSPSVSESYALEDMERLLEEARQEAYNSGFLAGTQQNNADLNNQQQTEWTCKLRDLNQLIVSLKEPFTIIDERIEEEMVKLVTVIASILYRRELSMNPEQILTIVKEAKNLLPSNHSNIRIHLNPEDSKLLQECSSDLTHEQLCQLFIEDLALKRGDCRVISDQTQVDASLEARVASIVEQVLQHAP
jgi:flagellar assembly protein FliH